MKTVIISLLSFFFIIGTASAEMITEYEDGALIIKKASTNEVKDFFRRHPYEYAVQQAEIPKIYFKRLPYDWNRTPENAAKNRTFIRILLPLVLKVNEEILQDRNKIIELYGKLDIEGQLSKQDEEYIQKLAALYDAYTPMKGTEGLKILIKQLINKVDAVPPSIMISTAVIYSNWGTSKLAVEDNSLYKEEVWYTNQGRKPQDDDDGDYRYKIYTDLEDGIRARALKINSHINYDYFRHTRLHQRKMGKDPNGVSLAAQMMFDSNIKNIGGMIDYTLSFYKLQYTDSSPRLVDFIIDEQP